MVLASPGSCVRGRVHRRRPSSRCATGRSPTAAFYVAVGVDLEGGRDVLGIWASPAAEGARYWLSVLTELRTGAWTMCSS